MKKCTKLYYKTVSSLLPIHGKRERIFLKSLKEWLIEFTSEADISYDDLCIQFGYPKEIVINYYSEIDVPYLQSELRRTHITRICLTMLVIIVFVIAVFLLFEIHSSYIAAENAIITYEQTVIE